MPMSFGVVWLLRKHALKCSDREFMFAKFREDTTEVRAGFKMGRIEFNCHEVTFTSCRKIAAAIEQLCKHKADVRGWSLSLQGCAKGFPSLNKLSCSFKLCSDIEKLIARWSG